MCSSNRFYHQRRWLDEIEAAMRTEIPEAKVAYFHLAELHLAECAACIRRRQSNVANAC